MTQRIIIVHGIHTNDDAGWMTTLAQTFTGYDFNVKVFTYGYAYAVLTRWQNPSRAKKLAEMIQPGDIVLGHSNGGCLAWMAAMLGAPIGGAILINPALDSNRIMPPHVKWVNLYPNRHDEMVLIAKLFYKHPWGAQGRDGIKYPDPRYLIQFSDTAKTGVPQVQGHSAVLEAKALNAWRHVFAIDAINRCEEVESYERAKA
jgi:pimeloyl-ACP methyl ester carboxylesterase